MISKFKAQFHSMHVATCVDFHIDLTGDGATGKSDCMQADPVNNGTMVYGTDYNDTVAGYQANYAQSNALNRNGYE